MKKILFNDQYGLTQAVLEGRKTMTRRIIPGKYQGLISELANPILVIPLESIPKGISIKEFAEQFSKCRSTILTVRKSEHIQVADVQGHFIQKVSRFQEGDVLAVAQNYKDVYSDKDFGKEGQIDWEYINSFDMRNTAGFTNKMFVRADLMPHQIRITHVRVERLQGINDKDCLREGIIENTIRSEFGGIINNYTYKGAPGVYVFPREAFSALINRLYGKGTWDSNPWVFVYEFELVK